MKKDITLTKQQIAKIFAQYIGQRVLMWNEDNNRESGTRTFLLTQVGMETCMGYFNEDNDYIHSKAGYNVDRFLLKLKPISKLPDDQALPENPGLVDQYLISEGYAVPLYIDINHPGNGQTAIDLGIAVEA